MTCASTSCVWVTQPYASPRTCFVNQPGRPRFAKVFGEDASGTPVVCDDGDHPLLSASEWCYVGETCDASKDEVLS